MTLTLKVLIEIEREEIREVIGSEFHLFLEKGSQQTPVSILDLNVPKTPGLTEDMNNDRRRGSPLNEERPRSPVRHRDRRRRSPHT